MPVLPRLIPRAEIAAEALKTGNSRIFATTPIAELPAAQVPALRRDICWTGTKTIRI
jgi:hypothetical protein